MKKSVQINTDKAKYAQSLGIQRLTAAHVGNFNSNLKTCGFGYNEFTANPFAKATQDTIDEFEAYKAAYGFPAGVWDGTF